MEQEASGNCGRLRPRGVWPRPQGHAPGEMGGDRHLERHERRRAHRHQTTAGHGGQFLLPRDRGEDCLDPDHAGERRGAGPGGGAVRRRFWIWTARRRSWDGRGRTAAGGPAVWSGCLSGCARGRTRTGNPASGPWRTGSGRGGCECPCRNRSACPGARRTGRHRCGRAACARPWPRRIPRWTRTGRPHLAATGSRQGLGLRFSESRQHSG